MTRVLRAVAALAAMSVGGSAQVSFVPEDDLAAPFYSVAESGRGQGRTDMAALDRWARQRRRARQTHRRKRWR